MADQKIPLKIVSMRDACELTSLSRTMIDKYRKLGRFPAAVSLGQKRFGFLLSEIQEWIEARVRERDQKAAA